MESISGVVERITYQNEENGYGVIKVRVKGSSNRPPAKSKFWEIQQKNLETNAKFIKRGRVKKLKRWVWVATQPFRGIIKRGESESTFETFFGSFCRLTKTNIWRTIDSYTKI